MVGHIIQMSNIGLDKDEIVRVEQGEEFVVERIVNHRFRNGRKEYLLAWKGYSEEENTWVQEIMFIVSKTSLSLF